MTIEIKIDNYTKIEQLIKTAIDKINNVLKENNMMLLCDKNDLSKFNLKPSKKNSKPNFDLPSNLFVNIIILRY
jgi:hypothetical protein